MFSDLLRQDREWWGLSVEEAGRRLRVSLGRYRQLEAGEAWSDWVTYDRICRAFGWPRSLR